MVYCAVIEDFSVAGASRYKVREIVDGLIGMNKELDKKREGETREERYLRLARQESLPPERIEG